MNKITVLGAGAWGTTIADLLGRNGNQVLLWSYEQHVAQDINDTHINSTYCRGHVLSGRDSRHAHVNVGMTPWTPCANRLKTLADKQPVAPDT